MGPMAGNRSAVRLRGGRDWRMEALGLSDLPSQYLRTPASPHTFSAHLLHYSPFWAASCLQVDSVPPTSLNRVQNNCLNPNSKTSQFQCLSLTTDLSLNFSFQFLHES